MNGQFAMDQYDKRMQQVQAKPCTCSSKKHNNYKLIFMDCNMPVMDGFMATTLIRERVKNQKGIEQPFIVALTAYNTE